MGHRPVRCGVIGVFRIVERLHEFRHWILSWVTRKYSSAAAWQSPAVKAFAAA